MSKRKKRASLNKKNKTPVAGKHNRRWIWMLVGVLFVFIFWKFLMPKRTAAEAVVYPKAGGADYCKHEPSFPIKYGLQSPLLIDLSQHQGVGLFIAEARQGGRRLQLPEWEFMGPLGPYALDEQGNIYIAPVPHVSIAQDKYKKQNRIYIIDGKSGVARLFIDLPAPRPISARNPFGVVGLSYDCDTHTLYASSIAGSTATEELGVIYRIDAKTGKILGQLEGMDVLGMGVFNHKAGKKLYMGLARKPEIYTVDLTPEGEFEGVPALRFSLQQLSGGQYENAHRIRFLRKNEMEIKAIEFNYTLMAASDPLRNIYLFEYNNEQDDWTFKDFYSQ